MIAAGAATAAPASGPGIPRLTLKATRLQPLRLELCRDKYDALTVAGYTRSTASEFSILAIDRENRTRVDTDALRPLLWVNGTAFGIDPKYVAQVTQFIDSGKADKP